MVVRWQRWALATLWDSDGVVLDRRAIGGPGLPDMGSVDRIARLLLEARRMGATVTLSQLDERLGELIVLAGLSIEVQR